MKNIHEESELDRIERTTETVKLILEKESMNVNNDLKTKSFDCTECGLLFKTSDDQNRHNQKDHASGLIPEIVVVKNYENNLIDLTESELSSSGDDSEDEDKINIEYEYTEDSETYKGKKPLFVQSVLALKQLAKMKDEIKIINNHTIVVRDFKKVKFGGLEAEVEISKGENKGVATLKIWGPSKSAKARKKIYGYD